MLSLWKLLQAVAAYPRAPSRFGRPNILAMRLEWIKEHWTVLPLLVVITVTDLIQMRRSLELAPVIPMNAGRRSHWLTTDER